MHHANTPDPANAAQEVADRFKMIGTLGKRIEEDRVSVAEAFATADDLMDVARGWALG